MQPDGKLVAVGEINPGVVNFYLVRYNTNGSPDSSFGAGGIVSTPNTSNGNAAVLQPDGKIVVVGDHGGEGCLVRYNSNGSLDSSFGIAGTGIWFSLARYKTNGTLDLAFGLAGTGIVTTNAAGGAGSIVQAALLQPNGKIIAIGQGAGNAFVLVRYTSGGIVDSSFGLAANNNIVTTPNTSNAKAAVLQPDGKSWWPRITMMASIVFFALPVITLMDLSILLLGLGGLVLSLYQVPIPLMLLYYNQMAK